MRATWIRVIILVGAGLAVPAAAQQKTESECLDIVSKHVTVLGGTLRESKPTGACALAKWAKNRHEELLRAYNTEPDECRKTALGKNLEKTLKVRIRQEANSIKKDCRR